MVLKRHLLYQIILCFGLFICLKTYAQETQPVKNFTPPAYGAEHQNWAISQTANHFIYVGNNIGLLEYNGSKWQLYPSPNGSVIRSVAVIDTKIYTGGFMDFGYWEKNTFGNLQYFSLAEKIKDQIVEEDYWNIISFDEFVLFQSLQRIYIYDTQKDSFNIIYSEVSLPNIFKIDKGLYFQKMGEGIFKIENGTPKLLSDDPVLTDNIVVNIYTINQDLYFQTQELGIYKIIDKKVSKWNIEANEILNNLGVYSSLQLNDGSIILGTISDGIYHIDQNGGLIAAINQEKGLNNNTVLSIFEDLDGNIWLGLDNGISLININSPISVYNDFEGNIGSIYASIIFDDNLYLGTNQGLFFKKLNSDDDFEFVEGTKGQVWCLKAIENTLFCGHNAGTFIVNNDKVDLISNLMGAWDIKPIFDSGLLLQGNYSGLSILEKKGKWL